MKEGEKSKFFIKISSRGLIQFVFRWDVQRIREQRHIEKLKQRQERIGSGARTDDHITNDETPESLWPSLDNIKFIEITENLPVAAFGCSVAQLAPR